MRSTAQVKKQELLTELKAARSALLAAAAALPQPARQRPLSSASGRLTTSWPHLVGWDAANLEAILVIGGKATCRPSTHSMTPTGAHTTPIWWCRTNAAVLEETLSAAQTSHRELLQALDVLPADDSDPGPRRAVAPGDAR